MSEYLIWSFEHNAWWNPNEAGYTGNVERAGRYSQQDAGRIVTQDVFNYEVAILETIALRRGPPNFHPYEGRGRSEEARDE